MLKKLVRLGCITQGSLAEITNQRFSLKYQTFRQLAAAFISGAMVILIHCSRVGKVSEEECMTASTEASATPVTDAFIHVHCTPCEI